MFFNLLADGVDAPVDEAVDTAQAFSWLDVWNTVKGWVLSTGIKVVIALVLLVIGLKVIDVCMKRLCKRLEKKGVDVTLTRVGTQIFRIALKLLLLVVLIGYVGIETASISAVIATLGVGISLAVQGTLANFAGGVIIIIMRPFKIGDFITSNGASGTVEDIKLFYTHIVTPDNQEIMIPNGALANNVIVNVTAKADRRVDEVVSIAYGADIDLAKKVMEEICQANELIFKDPAPFIAVSNMNDSSVDFVLRVWCKREDYWTVHFYLLESVKKAFDENGIEIPFNQLDVHIKDEKAN